LIELKILSIFKDTLWWSISILSRWWS